MRKTIENIKNIGDNIRRLYALLDYQLNKTNNGLDEINNRLLKLRKDINEQILSKLEPVYEIPIEFTDD